MIVAAAVGGDHHKRIVMSEKEQGHRVDSARLCSCCAQEQHVVVDKAATDPSAGELENGPMQR
jgi:hypothetical protein